MTFARPYKLAKEILKREMYLAKINSPEWKAGAEKHVHEKVENEFQAEITKDLEALAEEELSNEETM